MTVQAEKRNPGDAFPAADKKSKKHGEAAKPGLESSSLLPDMQPDAPPSCTLADKYESIVVPSDQEALRKVNTSCQWCLETCWEVAHPHIM